MDNQNKYKLLKKQYTLFLTAMSFLFIMTFVPSCTTKDVYTNAVRIHVVANSDSEADQSIKLKIRDKIVAELFAPLGQTASSDESYQYLQDNADSIEAIANEVLLQNDFSYSANVVIGIHTYPTRMYEQATLPAGAYRSVRVILGDGAGKNWWCVVYPPMCVDISEDEDIVVDTDDEINDSEENTENEEDIVFKSEILDKLGVDTPQPCENAKKRLLGWLNLY